MGRHRRPSHTLRNVLYCCVGWILECRPFMGLSERIPTYRKIESIRRCPLITYVTGTRQNAQGAMAADALPELIDQILLLPADAKKIELLIVSNGGDPTVAWRIMCLLRERVENVGVFIPQSAV